MRRETITRPSADQVNGLLEHMLRLRFGTDKVRFVDCSNRYIYARVPPSRSGYSSSALMDVWYIVESIRA